MLNLNIPLLDKWRFFMKDCTSPDAYIDMGFFYMMTAALQRRVWIGDSRSELSQLFPNMYVILCGPPATGKGLVLKQVASILRHHKMFTRKVDLSDLPAYTGAAANNPEADRISQAMKEAKAIAEATNAAAGKPADQELVIPVAADATTFESLLREMNKTTRAITYLDPTTGRNKKYVHKSLCFCLEEISSLLCKQTERVVRFLIVAFDCGDYDYVTKHQGEDRLRKTCLSFLGGTTPDFLRDTFNSKLLNEGFASRTVFVYEGTPRKYKFGVPEYSDEQLAARKVIVDHVRELTQLYGCVKFSKRETPEAWEIFQTYFEEILPIQRGNNNPKLMHYYGRKNIHAMKLATAIHFSRGLSLELTRQDCLDALTMLEELEKRMHLALNFSANPLAGHGDSVIKLLEVSQYPLSMDEIFKHMFNDVRETELMEILRSLVAIKKIEMVKIPGTTMSYVYQVVSKEKTVAQEQATVEAKKLIDWSTAKPVSE